MSGIHAAVASQALYTPPVTISITDQFISRYSIGGATVSATYTVNNDGGVRNHNGTLLETWNSTPGTVGSYEVRAILSSGNTPSGSALSTFLNCGGSQGWSLVASPGSSLTCVLSVSIRDATTLTVLDTATISLTAESEF